MTWLDSLTTKQSPTAIPLGSKGNSSTSGFLATLDKSAPKKEEDNTGIVKSLAHPFARIGTGLFNTFTGAGDVLASGIASVAGKKDTAQGFLKKAQSNITAKRDLGFFGTARPFGVAEQGVDTGKVEKGTRYAKDIVGGALELAPYVVGAPTALSAGKAGLAGLIGKSALQTGNFVGASSAVGMFGKGLQENKSLSQNLKDSTVSGAEGYAGGLLFGAAVPVVTRGIPALAKHSIVKGTGVNEATLEAPLKYGKEFRAARKNGLSRETIGKKVGGAFDTLLNNISDTGEGYNAVRESTAPVVVPTGYWTDKLKSLGITLGKDGVDRSASSRVLTQADKNAIDDFLGTYAKEGEQTASDFLKQREALANIAKYDMQKSTASTEVGKKLRAAFNNDIRPQIKGLAEIDEKYAPLVQFIKDTKRVIDKEGDVKLSSVVNSLKKGDSNVKTLKVLEELHPGITKDLEILAALEDVELASGHKVGAYASNFIFGGGVSAGLLGASGAGLPAAMAGLVGMVITNPKVVIPILEQVGIAKAVIAKIARGIKLSSAESAIVSKAMKEVEKNPTPEIRAMLALPAPSIKPPYAPKFGEPGYVPSTKSGLLTQSEAKARLLSEGKQGVYGKPLLGLPAPDKTKSGVAIPMRQSTQFEKPASIIGGEGQTSGLPLKKAEQPKVTKRGLKKQTPPQVKSTPVEAQKPSEVTRYHRGEPSGLTGRSFGGGIKVNKDGVPQTLGGNLGIPTSTDAKYVAKRFASEQYGEIGTYTPKGKIKVLSDPQEILALSRSKTPQDFYTKGKTPEFENGQVYKKAKELGYDAIDLTKIEELAKSNQPKGIHFSGQMEKEVRIINPDAFELKVTPKKSGPLSSNSPDAALMEEAKKYKSAEEYIKAQGDILYHGTPAKFETKDFKGGYLTADKNYADIYKSRSASSISYGSEGVKNKASGIPRTLEFVIKKDANLFDYTNPKHRALLKDYFGKSSMSSEPAIGRSGQLDWTEGENLREFFDEKGIKFDGIKLDEAGGIDPISGLEVRRSPSVLITNPKILKTKSQLLDIYNKANGK